MAEPQSIEGVEPQVVDGLQIYKSVSEDQWRALRALDITSTEVAALFGVHPRLTKFELWHRKKSALAVKFDPNERVEWGQRLEAPIAQAIVEDQKWNGRPMKEYIRDPKLRIGASFDWEVQDFPADAMAQWAILEIKNVDSLIFRDDWIVDLETNFVEAPPHIEFQVMHQMLVARRPRAYIGVLIGGNRLELLRREANEDVFRAIRLKVAQFWESIEANTPPPADFARDYSTIARLYGYAEPNKIMDASGNQELIDLCARDAELLQQEKDIKLARDTVKAKTLTLIGDAEKVILGPGLSISASVVPPAHVEAHDRAAYRLCRFNRPKVKK